MIVNRYKKKIMVRRLWDRFIKNEKATTKEEECCRYKNAFYQKYGEGFSEPKIETIQIETINRCNGTCSFCPVNKYVDSRKMTQMEPELFKKIIQELVDMNYTGRIALFSNNEPLLDFDIEKKAEYVKKKLPKSFVYLYTNGTLMNVERFKKLVNWLDQMIIDNYNDNLKINENLKKIAELCLKDETLNKKVEIHLRKENEVLYTRGGQAPNNTKKEIRDYPCFLPFNQLIIRPDGKVSLCCSDALGKMTLGDIKIQSIKEIWTSETYSEIRGKIIEDISSIELCKYCDAKHYN